MGPEEAHAGVTPRGSTGRVLHVAHHALPHVGGLETVADAETVGLAARGWEVTLLSSATATVPGTHLEHGVRRIRVPAWNGLETQFGVPFPVFSPRLVVALLREVRRADLVHVHDALYLTSWVAAAWCWVLRRPYVVHRHVGFVHHSSRLVRAVQRLVLGTIARLVLDRAALVIAIDEFIATGLRATLRDPSRVHVLGNGVDTARFRPAAEGERAQLRRERGLPTDEPLVLFVGRFVPKKGFPLVAGAASSRYRLVFVGGERPTGMEDPRLLFLGSRAPAEMPDVYRCADLLVVASVGECPLTVLEALSSGIPVVLNEDPALHSPWTTGPGVHFVETRDDALAGCLERLVADPAALEEMGRAGHELVHRSFSWEAHLTQLDDIYRDLLANGHVPVPGPAR